MSVLPVLRSNLVSGVARVLPTSEIRQAAQDASNKSDGDIEIFAATTHGDSAVEDLAAAAPDSVDALVRAIATTDSEVVAAAAAFATIDDDAPIWSQIRNDGRALQNGDLLLAAPLWHGDENPFQETWDAVLQSLTKSQGYGLNYGQDYGGIQPIDWSFWINWYQDALEGREPDWEMLEEIALIPDEDWEKGPEHINNQVIAGIVEKYRLLREVQELRKELAAVRQTATAAPMGHNNPPEGIEAEAEIDAQTDIIWVALEEAEEELSKPEPSPSILKRVGAAILKALKYCVDLADIAVKSAAKEGGATIGKWGARGLIAWVAVQNPHLVSLGQQLIEYANSLRK